MKVKSRGCIKKRFELRKSGEVAHRKAAHGHRLHQKSRRQKRLGRGGSKVFVASPGMRKKLLKLFRA